jgi:hypothetical protein
MKRSKLTLLTYHRTTTHYGKLQRNIKDQLLLYHRLENKAEVGRRDYATFLCNVSTPKLL